MNAPLVRNTFVKVTLKAPVLTEQILLPVTAIHDNKIYTLDQDSKLVIKPVEIDFIQQQIAVIGSGLELGDKVILSPLSPAIEGMKLKPQQDLKTINWLEQTTGFKDEKTNKEKALL
ncbi:hypothetical protein ACLKMH_10390 [Psychromonas sp. KJ10-10]|uniref:hypothetical protein n=1 Tax=Psychromonas sp. KJ10-10 TaxID=3391823 RepID=UPI0039B62763